MYICVHHVYFVDFVTLHIGKSNIQINNLTTIHKPTDCRSLISDHRLLTILLNRLRIHSQGIDPDKGMENKRDPQPEKTSNPYGKDPAQRGIPEVAALCMKKDNDHCCQG